MPGKTEGSSARRFWEVDAFRGLALAAMIVYHAVFDLVFFKGYAFTLDSGFWFFWARATASSFLFIAGVSLFLSDSRLAPSQRLAHHWKRAASVFLAGLLVTAVTLVLFPREAVWFGILHAIAVCLFLFAPLARLGKWNLALAALVLLAFPFLSAIPATSPYLLWLGWIPSGFRSLDFVPLIPWAAPFLAGLGIAPWLMAWLRKRRSRPPVFLEAKLAWVGRHSLIVYLLHQPVLVAAILLLA